MTNHGSKGERILQKKVGTENKASGFYKKQMLDYLNSYMREFISKQEMKIAVIPLGYADGINRKLGSKKEKVLINNALAPILGEISMDSFMVDISGINAKEGDLVNIFSQKNSVAEIAKNLDTIPYEILATLNRRIKRIYQ